MEQVWLAQDSPFALHRHAAGTPPGEADVANAVQRFATAADACRALEALFADIVGNGDDAYCLAVRQAHSELLTRPGLPALLGAAHVWNNWVNVADGADGDFTVVTNPAKLSQVVYRIAAMHLSPPEIPGAVRAAIAYLTDTQGGPDEEGRAD